MAFIIFIFVVAAAISTVAAYFSLVGLGSIFAATFWGVVIMGGTLEVGKIVTTKWVHANWRNPQAPWYFRGLLCFFVACLMAITSLGIYGYLSRGHLEQQAPLAGLSIQTAQLESQVKQKQDENAQLQTRLGQINRITDKNLETSGQAGLRASSSQKREAADIQKHIDDNNKVINDLTTQLVPLKMKAGDVQGEVGVAKFIAEAAGWSPDTAIRIIISLIMSAFDPLALSMFIMGSISLTALRESKMVPKEEPVAPAEKPVVEEYIFPATTEGRGSLVTELPKGDSRLPLPDAIYFEKKLNEAKAQVDQDREEFENAMAEISKSLEEQTSDLEAAKAQVVQDQAALQEAHSQLLDMESRLNDERELLTSWEKDLTAQQEAINKWKPETAVDDGRDPKELIIELLELNPDIVNDIVQVSQAMRNSRPGL